MAVLREVTPQSAADQAVRARDDDLHAVRVDRGAPTGVWWKPRVTCPGVLHPDLGLERALLDASLDRRQVPSGVRSVHQAVVGADAARYLSAVKARIEEGAFESEVGMKHPRARHAGLPPHAGGSPAVYPDLSLIHISEPTRLRRISYAVFCLKKKKKE